VRKKGMRRIAIVRKRVLKKTRRIVIVKRRDQMRKMVRRQLWM
jgi:hypothetical protein